MAQTELRLYVESGEFITDVLTAVEVMKDEHREMIAQYMRDICTQNMMDEDDAAKAANWRTKAEAWEKVRDAYALRAHGKSEQDLLTAPI